MCDQDQAAEQSVDNSYGYDANGNQVTRVINGVTLTLGYDAKGHLLSVSGQGINAAFTYDGDAKRVKSTINGETTYFVGNYYEQTGTTITKYYYAGATRIAMRRYTIPQNMTVEYFLGDHLGSTSLTMDSAGQKVSEMRYTPWSEVRYAWKDQTLNTTPDYTLTRWTFTGQYSYADDPTTEAVEDFGLLFFNARWLDGYLNHFTQPDSIVPDPYNSQDWDRYAYARNNPIRYNDPSGHKPCDNEYGCDNRNSSKSNPIPKKAINNNDQPERLSPCERIIVASSCQTASKLLGVGVIALDSISLGLSATGLLLELLGAAAGPEGLAAAIGLYAETLNPIENTLGGASLALSAANDFFITGESYIDLDNTYQGTPSIELVLGSDTSVGIVATSLGLSPEGASDSIINGSAVAYDAYRLSGGKQLVQSHIILTANLNLHFNFSFP